MSIAISVSKNRKHRDEISNKGSHASRTAFETLSTFKGRAAFESFGWLFIEISDNLFSWISLEIIEMNFYFLLSVYGRKCIGFGPKFLNLRL